MSVIPLDLQRRFEQRWAVRFIKPVTSVVKSAALKSPLRIGRRTQQKNAAAVCKEGASVEIGPGPAAPY
jgi:hypothetical protein